MADPKGFLTTPRRELPARRPVDVRIHGLARGLRAAGRRTSCERQAGRCMDCGIPFCHDGCPLGNLIPEWNDLVWRDDWQPAIERLHATNNFPEFTGRLCPAPCEGSCVLGINSEPVTIKQVEVSIIDRAWDEGWVTPQPPERLSGKTVAVVGSGPAGLAAAQQLTRAGHTVVVLERADAIGGLLRYGIPEFKMEKRHLDRRLEQMAAEGTRFKTGVDVGAEDVDAARAAGQVRRRRARDRRDRRRATCRCPAASSAGCCRRWTTSRTPTARPSTRPGTRAPRCRSSAAGKHVVIIGGGDTGADCLGTAHRQGAASVTQLEILPRPADARPDSNPWPTWPLVYRTSSAHEEGGDRVYAVSTTRLRRRRARRRTVPGARRGDHAWTAGSSRCPAPSGRSRPTWCCSRWASSARSAPGWWSSSASSCDARGNVAPRRRLHDLGARGVRGR